jgi:4-azaleucine resistance transporter AzlC
VTPAPFLLPIESARMPIYRHPAFAAGARAILPVLLGIIPFGVITGVAMVASGIPPLEAMAMSVIVFAGAAMVAAAQLLVSDAPALIIVLTTVVINLRLVMYSASLRLYFADAPLGRRLAVAYFTVDNVYGVMLGRFAEHPDDTGKFEYMMGASLPVWVAWQAATLAGVLIGAGVPAEWRLEFAAPLAFIAISIPFLRDRATIAAALAAGIAVLAFQDLPLKLSLIVAAAVGIAVGMLVGSKL